MRELDNILAAYERFKERGMQGVLATVVHVEGSSYRRAGARMLVDEYGELTGAISGGCLEGDALRKALWALEQGRTKLVTYDTTDESDAVVGAQLGCNGIIQVLFEPVDPNSVDNPCEMLSRLRLEEGAAVMGVFFDLDKSSPQPGTQWWSVGGRSKAGQGLPDGIAGRLEEISREAIDLGRHVFLRFEGAPGGQAFLQYCPPPVRLVIIGAGNDARALSDQALLLGWRVSVVDGRPSHASEDRFGSACQVVVARPEDSLKQIPGGGRTCFVLMSHNYQYDLSVLRLLLDAPEVPYVGILGPRKKYERMREELLAEGNLPAANWEACIFAPVGLEIGAETPAEIALSVLAEIQAVLGGTHLRHLRDRSVPIHDRQVSSFKSVRL